MITLFNIARPYALAAFEYARDQHTLSTWKSFLTTLATIAKQPAVVRLLNHPAVLPGALFDLFMAVWPTPPEPAQQHFLLLLAQNKRLMALPEIARTFHTYCDTFEKTCPIRIVSALPMEADDRQTFTQILSKRLQQTVTLQCENDPSLLGGAMIYIGDQVIDGSIRGKLTRLLDFSLR